jgi:hypothetical protein
MELLKAFPWGTNRKALEKALGNYCVPHPTQNAFGLEGDLYDAKSLTVLRFVKSTFNSKLVEVNVTFDSTAMTDEKTEAIYQEIRKDIVSSYRDPELKEGYNETTPINFRFSIMEKWTTQESVIVLTKRLISDGFSKDKCGVGFVAQDKRNHPLSPLYK